MFTLKGLALLIVSQVQILIAARLEPNWIQHFGPLNLVASSSSSSRANWWTPGRVPRSPWIPRTIERINDRAPSFIGGSNFAPGLYDNRLDHTPSSSSSSSSSSSFVDDDNNFVEPEGQLTSSGDVSHTDHEEGIVMNEASTHTNNHQSLIRQDTRHYGSGTFPLAAKLAYNPSPFAINSLPKGQANLNYMHATLMGPLKSQAAGGATSSSLNSLLDNMHYQALKQGSHHFQPAMPTTADPMMALNQLNSVPPPGDLIASATACGRQQVSAREPRIVGGNSTYEGEFPWAVSIQRHGSHHCGGVIVGRRWVLTAAHCVRNQLVANLVVRTGGHTLQRSPNSLTSHLEQDHLVEQIIMHDDFSRYDNLTASLTKSSANTNNADIALLRLRHEIQWSEFAWPVCLPVHESGNFSGHEAIVIGWGKLNEKSDEFSNELQKVKLTIIDNRLCQNWFRQAGREMPIDERVICAGFKNGGKDACHGDSGGPLLSRVNGHYAVVGVVSTGIGCARPLLPGLYARVSSYIGWIESHVD